MFLFRLNTLKCNGVANWLKVSDMTQTSEGYNMNTCQNAHNSVTPVVSSWASEVLQICLS